MNAFWKRLVASIVAYQLVLTYCVLDLTKYVALQTVNIHDMSVSDHFESYSVILGGALIALAALTLVGLYRSTRPAQDG